MAEYDVGNFNGSAVLLIGLLLGIDLIFTGVTSMAVGAKLKSVTR
jgi:uncharacterized membrane protein HdeD (DUF308 family)